MQTYTKVRDDLLTYLEGDLALRPEWSDDQRTGHKAALAALATTPDLFGAARVFQESLLIENKRLPDALSYGARMQYSDTADKFVSIMMNEAITAQPETFNEVFSVVSRARKSVREAEGQKLARVIPLRRKSAPVMK